MRLRAPPLAGSLLWLWGWHWPFVKESPQGSPSSRKLSLQMSPGRGMEGDSQGSAQPLGHLGSRLDTCPQALCRPRGDPGSSLQPGLQADAAWVLLCLPVCPEAGPRLLEPLGYGSPGRGLNTPRQWRAAGGGLAQETHRLADASGLKVWGPWRQLRSRCSWARPRAPSVLPFELPEFSQRGCRLRCAGSSSGGTLRAPGASAVQSAEAGRAELAPWTQRRTHPAPPHSQGCPPLRPLAATGSMLAAGPPTPCRTVSTPTETAGVPPPRSLSELTAPSQTPTSS